MKHGVLPTGLTRFNGGWLACFPSAFLMPGVSLSVSTEEETSSRKSVASLSLMGFRGFYAVFKTSLIHASFSIMHAFRNH